ncbi:hypothetical protein DT037_15605 [Pseudomonas fulva]|uniref:hypothetical protein n=1 Tax=Pseudomonas putida group TaxID=136845 RepID=UPI0015F43B4E|nr:MULTISPECIES: hypothetical protein [Pseudomonas putida group]MBA5708478.1 hypothetical protein [Pseudomonas fulva]MBF8726602.1 hypothetical protein [Pseudomonas putida]
MEVFEQLRAFYSSGASWLIALATIVYQGAKRVNQLIKALDWHDKYFVLKRMNRLRKRSQTKRQTPSRCRLPPQAFKMIAGDRGQS